MRGTVESMTSLFWWSLAGLVLLIVLARPHADTRTDDADEPPSQSPRVFDLYRRTNAQYLSGLMWVLAVVAAAAFIGFLTR